LIGALFLLSVSSVSGVGAQDGDPLARLLFLAGSWHGEGDGSYGPYTFDVEIERRGNWLIARNNVMPEGDPNARFIVTTLYGFDDRGKLVNHSFDNRGVLVAKGRFEIGGVSFSSKGGGVRQKTTIKLAADGSVHFEGEVHLEYTSAGEPRDLHYQSTMVRRGFDDGADDEAGGIVDVEEIEKQVARAFSAYTAKVDGGDWEATVSHYSDDPRFYWVEAGRLTYESKQSVVEALESAYSQLQDFRFDTSNVRVTALSATVAVLTADFEQTLTFGESEPLTLSGVLTTVMQKGPDDWQFLVGHSSTVPDATE
jgi:ketosteroid isomerase-like protein